MGILKIDTDRYVTKKEFRELTGINSANLYTMTKRDGKIDVKLFPELGIELIDMDSIGYHTFGWNSRIRDLFKTVKDGKYRFKERKKITASAG